MCRRRTGMVNDPGRICEVPASMWPSLQCVERSEHRSAPFEPAEEQFTRGARQPNFYATAVLWTSNHHPGACGVPAVELIELLASTICIPMSFALAAQTDSCCAVCVPQTQRDTLRTFYCLRPVLSTCRNSHAVACSMLAWSLADHSCAAQQLAPIGHVTV